MMIDTIHTGIPGNYERIREATTAAGFTMSSDIQTCSLLRTLAAAKPGGRFLELGTGTGLSAAWLLDGMDKGSTLVSVDNDARFQDIAKRYLSGDWRLTLVEADGGEWIAAHAEEKFDFIFADTWPGKYEMLEETLTMLKKGGFYILDDMLPQANWPEGHADKVAALIGTLEQRTDLVYTKQAWATGMIVCVKR